MNSHFWGARCVPRPVGTGAGALRRSLQFSEKFSRSNHVQCTQNQSHRPIDGLPEKAVRPHSDNRTSSGKTPYRTISSSLPNDLRLLGCLLGFSPKLRRSASTTCGCMTIILGCLPVANLCHSAFLDNSRISALLITTQFDIVHGFQ